MTVSPDPSDTITVDLKIRSRLPTCVSERIEVIIERIRTLTERGLIDELRMSDWDRLYLDGTAQPRAGDQETLRRFFEWAADNGFALRPAFRTRDCSTMVDSSHRTVVEVPFISMAIFEGETLQCVVPYSNGDTIQSVEGYLNSLERGEVGPSLERLADAGRTVDPIELHP